MRDLFIYLLFQLRNVRKEGVRSVKCTVVGVNMHMSGMSVCLRVSTEYEKTAKAYQRVHMGTFITLSMVYAFPCVFLCPRMSACAHVCACVHSGLPPPRVPCVCVRVCVRACCVCVCACAYVFQESQWLDSVSLLIKDTLEGEMLMIDNLSGSVFHHYSSPQLICKDCKGHPQEVPP